MNLGNVWNKIGQLLTKVNFGDIWKGFRNCPFALYDDEHVVINNQIRPINDQFVANTVIDYEGEKIAIWHITSEDMKSMDVLASNIVHEMFHAFQQNQQEKRFPNDLEGLNKPEKVSYYHMKYQEGQYLKDALEMADSEKKYKQLLHILALREKRLIQFKSATTYELAIETVEGTAEYVGLMALKQLNESTYEQRLNQYKKNLADKQLLFHPRRYSYYYGSLLLVLLNQLNIPFNQRIGNEERTIFESLSESIQERVMVEKLLKDKEIESELYNNIEMLRQKFTEFNQNKTMKQTGLYKIIGYDPMNMYKMNTFILHENFVSLLDRKSEKNLFLKGPVITIYNQDEIDVIGFLTQY